MTTMFAALALVAVTVQATAVNPQAAALAEFSQRLKAYVALRAKLANKLEPMSSTASASDLQARQEALAAAIRSARARAKPGDLIPQPVRRQIRETVAADFRNRQPATKRAALEEVPKGPLPGINKDYPEQAALATVPPLLLQNLPPLPDNLQYRFFGRHLVILDGDVEIVVDYVQNVVPR
jgi:predicted acylesterase/phospholipase RssA